ncbi:hypothetical protein DFH09DRAFT_1308940 [Mycena vulgaris]|nr:hypothetical protein DFH09DRAFT_1308940 [Mycena vulgaris]
MSSAPTIESGMTAKEVQSKPLVSNNHDQTKVEKKKPVDDDAPYSPTSERNPDPEAKAQRHRETERAYYRRHPEVREKKRVQMAEKRAAIRARRRQWDPPKKIKPQLPPSLSPGPDEQLNSQVCGMTPPSPGLPASRNDVASPGDNSAAEDVAKPQNAASVGSATSAERLAAMILAGMAHQQLVTAAGITEDNAHSLRSFPIQLSSCGDEEDSVLAKAMELSSISSSELERAVHDAAQTHAPDVTGACGSTGAVPLLAQAPVAMVERESRQVLEPTREEADHWADTLYPEFPAHAQTISRQRWMDIRTWEGAVAAHHDEGWDGAG